jgi:hypothetical protein
VLHGPFAPLGPKQFELLLPSSEQQPLPAPVPGTFSTPRRGKLSVPSPTQINCPHTGWPRTLRFSLTAVHRIAVADGLWTGTVDSPAGVSGSVKIRVIDRGRIETDFSDAYTCPPPDGATNTFELGPLPTTGFLIAADGSIGGTPRTETVWRGKFAPDGVLSGQFTASDCSPAVDAEFTARRTGT